MSTMAVEEVALAPVDQGFWTRDRKVGVGLVGAGLLAAVIFGALATGERARFTLSDDSAGAALSINGTIGAILFGLIAVAAGAALLVGVPSRWFPLLLGAGVVGFVLSFLCWQVSAAPPGQNFMPMVNIIRGTFILALPLIFGSLAGVLCERSGVVNVAIEGQLLMGAFAGALFAFSKGSISPETLSVPRSVDALVMVFLGGIQTLTGPLWGAALFTWLEDSVSRGFEYWRAVIGGIILVLVLAFPQGVAGFLKERFAR